MADMPIIPKLANADPKAAYEPDDTGDEDETETEGMDEVVPSADGMPSYDDAQRAVTAAEMYATDAEAIAAEIPKAKAAAKNARKLADKVSGLMDDVDSAHSDTESVDEADPTAMAAAKVAEAQLIKPVMDALTEVKAAYEEARAFMPALESHTEDGPNELATWAESKLTG